MSATRQEAAMRQVFERVVADPDLHWATMNLYYYSEYHGAEGIAALAKRAESTNPQLAEELVHHADDEFRHAAMIADIMTDLGSSPRPPLGIKYVDEFAALATASTDPDRLDEVELLAALNVTEKRGLFSFALHVSTLPKESKAFKLLNQVKNEEAGHVRWGNQRLAELKASGREAEVRRAQAKFEVIEKAAYETSLDIMPGAPIRHFRRIVDVAQELPTERQIPYVVSQFLRAANPLPVLGARWQLVETILSSAQLREQVSEDVRRMVAGQSLSSDSLLGRLAGDARRAVESLWRPQAQAA
ncbi:ferritin-like domain-containing protein [Chloracidobacterium validum]|uniref:Ferritin-like domain-containing protein n=1 Tax=Chloracidobacterium validum TaxID=2821543 RepID=A0ABX8B927_9BACT|nr:ferritin-like domain-containing protein [Chloracidobacterium validum]QUW02155.1 ferritin-like domain-containing protein [Chloracidobacterium validum]